MAVLALGAVASADPKITTNQQPIKMEHESFWPTWERLDQMCPDGLDEPELMQLCTNLEDIYESVNEVAMGMHAKDASSKITKGESLKSKQHGIQHEMKH